MEHVQHTINPIYNEKSNILILGTFPSVKSRENKFFYSHPQNRFWKIIAYITNTSPVPSTIDEKKNMLLNNKIALFDVIKSCDITGSSDTSIKNVEPWDLSIILDSCNIKKIYANGNKAYELYMKYCYNNLKRSIIKLPSTSPANASFNFERLLSEWSQIFS